MCAFSAFSSVSYAVPLTDFTSISQLELLKLENNKEKSIQISAPYRVLHNAVYTYKLDTFQFNNNHKSYLAKILNSENPNTIQWEIEKTRKAYSPAWFNLKQLADKVKLVETKKVWWSKFAPTALRTLDYSKIDGRSDYYKLNDEYQLSLMSHQGAWGRVYLLEKINKDLKPETICVVKVLLNKTEKPMSVANFRERHKAEVNNTLLISEGNNIAINPYAILKNSDDNYLLFLEYGEDSRDEFKKLDKAVMIDTLLDFIGNLNKFHQNGFTHGDLTINNMLFVGNKIKLCDWYSLKHYTNLSVENYRYDGDNLPPEAILAYYYRNSQDKLKYSIVAEHGKEKFRYLHPVAADRFCLGVTLLEIIAPDLYDKFEKAFWKGFNPYKPDSLDFLNPYLQVIEKVQAELFTRASVTKNMKEKQLLKQLAVFIDKDPVKRKLKVN